MGHHSHRLVAVAVLPIDDDHVVVVFAPERGKQPPLFVDRECVPRLIDHDERHRTTARQRPGARDVPAHGSSAKGPSNGLRAARRDASGNQRAYAHLGCQHCDGSRSSEIVGEGGRIDRRVPSFC
jgi:hypothetical protein